MRPLLPAVLIIALAGPAVAMPPPLPSVGDRSMADLQADIAGGRATEESVTSAYIRRGKALDPQLRSIIAVNPNALSQAYAADQARRGAAAAAPLFGMPILFKDNIETLDPMATTAGSLALAGNVTGRDAPVVARLRAAGVVILGKANLSEWANIRSDDSLSGWSAVGGQARNP